MSITIRKLTGLVTISRSFNVEIDSDPCKIQAINSRHIKVARYPVNSDKHSLAVFEHLITMPHREQTLRRAFISAIVSVTGAQAIMDHFSLTLAGLMAFEKLGISAPPHDCTDIPGWWSQTKRTL